MGWVPNCTYILAKEMRNLAGLIAGAFKIIEPTEKHDSSKRIKKLSLKTSGEFCR